MTVLNKYIDNRENLEELLIKNLPSSIKAGNEKHNSNIFTIHTYRALKTCKFINYNTQERISFMIFDFDTYNNKNAIETFKNIDMFIDYITNKIGLEPTFITQTSKGYHFAYHLKNHIFTNQAKALKYLNDIKRGIIKKVGCDTNGSVRNYGIWRNPLKHNHYFSGEINYELNNFKEFAIPFKTIQQKFRRDITIRQVNNDILIKGNRNNVIFLSTMQWAKYRKNLTQEDIFIYAKRYNQQAQEPLADIEIQQIAKSVYRYYSKGLIYIASKERDINEGIMGFPKIKDLEHNDFLEEVKRRQILSASRTNSLIDKETKKELMLNAKKAFIERQKITNEIKIKKAIEELENLGKKVNNSAIARIAGLNRKTVGKYMSGYNL